jgi:hypothetical protein
MSIVAGLTQIGHYVFTEEIGRGAFSCVWLAMHKLTRLQVAAKVVLKSSIVDEDSVTRFTRELSFMKQMRHPFIAEFYEFLEDEQAYYYFMEYAENGSLLRYVMMNGPMSEAQARHYFSQLVSVLEYLHRDLRVCHRDVKAENLLLDRHNNIRVIDFGLSNQFSSSRPLLNTACGSPPYAPPEMIRGNPYTQAADIWSSGILLYSLTTGLLPFDDDNLQVLLSKILTQEVDYPSFLSTSVVDLLRRMLTKNPDFRITLQQMQEHPWMSQGKCAALFAMRLGESPHDAIVDHEIVEEMASMGIETAQLRQQLLLGVFTELTAMYQMIRRHRLTDALPDLLTAGAEATGCPARGASTYGRLPRNPPRPVLVAVTTRRPGQRATAFTPAPMSPGTNGNRVQSPVPLVDVSRIPAAVQVVTTRRTRPIARNRGFMQRDGTGRRASFDDCDVVD